MPHTVVTGHTTSNKFLKKSQIVDAEACRGLPRPGRRIRLPNWMPYESLKDCDRSPSILLLAMPPQTPTPTTPLLRMEPHQNFSLLNILAVVAIKAAHLACITSLAILPEIYPTVYSAPKLLNILFFVFVGVDQRYLTRSQVSFFCLPVAYYFSSIPILPKFEGDAKECIYDFAIILSLLLLLPIISTCNFLLAIGFQDGIPAMRYFLAQIKEYITSDLESSPNQEYQEEKGGARGQDASGAGGRQIMQEEMTPKEMFKQEIKRNKEEGRDRRRAVSESTGSECRDMESSIPVEVNSTKPPVEVIVVNSAAPRPQQPFPVFSADGHYARLQPTPPSVPAALPQQPPPASVSPGSPRLPPQQPSQARFFPSSSQAQAPVRPPAQAPVRPPAQAPTAMTSHRPPPPASSIQLSPPMPPTSSPLVTRPLSAVLESAWAKHTQDLEQNAQHLAARCADLLQDRAVAAAHTHALQQRLAQSAADTQALQQRLAQSEATAARALRLAAERDSAARAATDLQAKMCAARDRYEKMYVDARAQLLRLQTQATELARRHVANTAQQMAQLARERDEARQARDEAVRERDEAMRERDELLAARGDEEDTKPAIDTTREGTLEAGPEIVRSLSLRVVRKPADLTATQKPDPDLWPNTPRTGTPPSDDASTSTLVTWDAPPAAGRKRSRAEYDADQSEDADTDADADADALRARSPMLGAAFPAPRVLDVKTANSPVHWFMEVRRKRGG
ncbi:hypothetical protein GGX14DRAFT_671445 [Mycena pura]|uniref:Uncharacterized protein n=1 Tax=Mycena pura TaxID=153505 RepID=A0AAD6Y1T0_9AGAR|nr:hypothetical protein GGX14DRAFT_671445 [Mycena pura]